MIVTALLSFAFVFCLLYGLIPLPALLAICSSLSVLLAWVSRHGHSETLSQDVLAQISRLKDVNAGLKTVAVLALMVTGIASRNAYTGIFLMLAMALVAVGVGGISLHHYIYALALPISFLLIGGLALLFEARPDQAGVISINVFDWFWLSVSREAQAATALVVSRAMGAVSCLCFLGMTTPMPDIIAVLRAARCPDLIIDLMYLIYRYIFILLGMHHEMYEAAKSRSGMRDYKSSIRSTGLIYSNLLARSHRLASTNFDAMESRCFDTGIRFLASQKPVTAPQACVAAVLFASAIVLALLPI